MKQDPMSTTDNAFIKAYAEELAVALGRPAKQVDRRTIRPDAPSAASPQPGPRVSVSGLYAASGDQQPAIADAPPLEIETEVSTEIGSAEDLTVTDVVSPAVAVAMASAPAVAPARQADQGPTMVTPAEVIDLISRPNDVEETRRLDPANSSAPPQWHASFAQVVAKAAVETAGPDAFPEPTAETESPSGKVPPPPAAPSAFRPQWEVDQFQWPAAVDMLIEEYADWLTGVLDRLASHEEPSSPVTAVTGYARGEGRTTLTLALARLAASRGLSVILVDGDHDAPQVAQQLGLSFNAGWDERADDSSSLAGVAIQSLEENLAVLPLKPRDSAKPDPDRQPTTSAIAALSADYDLVLVDVGPMFSAVRHWFDREEQPAIDGVLVIRDLRSVTDQQLDDVLQRLASREIPVVGIAENFGSQCASHGTDHSKLAS